MLLSEKTKEMDTETHFKDTFRVFSKDEEGLLMNIKISYIFSVRVNNIIIDGIWAIQIICRHIVTGSYSLKL